MVSKHLTQSNYQQISFRAVLFRMVSKPEFFRLRPVRRFRAVLFRMVSKQDRGCLSLGISFRAVLFRMVSKPML